MDNTKQPFQVRKRWEETRIYLKICFFFFHSPSHNLVSLAVASLLAHASRYPTVCSRCLVLSFSLGMNNIVAVWRDWPLCRIVSPQHVILSITSSSSSRPYFDLDDSSDPQAF